MEVSLEILSIAGLAFLYLLYKIFELQRKVGKPEVIYMDTSGIESLKERQYIDIERNKALNLKIGEDIITIIHLPWKVALNHIEKLAQLWNACRILAEYETKNDLEEKIKSLRFGQYYLKIAKHIYQIARPYVKKKGRLKKTINRIARTDVEGLMEITEKIFAYWVPLKKKRQILAQGGTLQSMVGAQFAWSSLELDSEGRAVIKPRFMKS